jgi:hypothetical protein
MSTAAPRSTSVASRKFSETISAVYSRSVSGACPDPVGVLSVNFVLSIFRKVFLDFSLSSAILIGVDNSVRSAGAGSRFFFYGPIPGSRQGPRHPEQLSEATDAFFAPFQCNVSIFGMNTYTSVDSKEL